MYRITLAMRSLALFAGVVGVALSLLFGSEASAQSAEPPRISRGSDPNDWEAYYEKGIEELRRDPRRAEALFVWASRLRPDRAEPLYARWIAFWARDISRFQRYISGDATTLREPQVRRADSLRVRALWRNPFVHEGLVLFLYDALPGRFRDDAVTRTWIALGRAELPQAITMFGGLIRRDPSRYGYLRFTRASAFVNTGQADSAMAELAALLTQLRADDASLLVGEYQSKALIEHATGLLQLHLARPEAARAAFGRAIAENAAFAPAHAKLGEMALSRRDTAEALSELGLAVEIDPTDVELRVALGTALRQAKHLAEAIGQFRKAVALEPLYAAPYLLLASALEDSGDRAGALEAYRQCLLRTTKADIQRSRIERKIQALSPPR